MSSIHIEVIVPKNRSQSGTAQVKKNGRILRQFEVLARGSKGPGDTQYFKEGNTPVGDYDGTFGSATDFPADSYGTHGYVRMKPLSGNALLAEQAFGRTGILIHSGTLGGPSYWRGYGALRATKGCLRVREEDMEFLQKLLSQPKAANQSHSEAPHEVRITVREN